MEGFEFSKNPEREAGSAIHIEIPKRERSLTRGGSKDCSYIVDLTEGLEGAVSLPETAWAEGQKFHKKKEFHSTAIGFNQARALKKIIKSFNKDPQLEHDFVTRVNEILSDIDFSFDLNLKDAKYVRSLNYDSEAVKNGGSFTSEATIIVDIRMPGVEELYDRINKEFGIDMGSPNPHITLYIKDQEDPETVGLGIGLNNLEKIIGTKVDIHDIDISDLIK